MDTLSAYAVGNASRNEPKKVFDWHKAARLIKEHDAQEASAGLAGDWEWTGGPILSGGEPVPEDETYVYLSSRWATPELKLDGELMACFVMQDDSPGWDSKTYWPKSALALLS